MSLLQRFIVVIPLVLSIVGFVLSSLSLFAGHKDGFMEDYAIARVNVSMIGQDLITSSSDDSDKDDDDDDGGFLDTIKDKWDDAKEGVIDKINDVIGDAAGDVADAIGISDWYSIHVMNACEGDFKNASASNSGFNGTNCTDSSPAYRLNLTAMLDREISVGPFDVNLADLGWESKIQEKLDKINDVLLGLFVLFVLGMGFSGLALLGCVPAALFPQTRVLPTVNLAASSLAFLSLAIASIIVTVAATKGVDEINDAAEEVGVNVEKGTKFMAITWVATGAMLSTTVFWAVKFVGVRREARRNMFSEKRSSI